MLRWLANKWLDRRAAAARKALQPLDWQSTRERILSVIGDHAVYLEHRQGHFVLPDDYDGDHTDIVGLVVAQVSDELKPWDTESYAFDMRRKLSEHLGVTLPVLLSRELDTFAGYYVRIRSDDIAAG